MDVDRRNSPFRKAVHEVTRSDVGCALVTWKTAESRAVNDQALDRIWIVDD